MARRRRSDPGTQVGARKPQAGEVTTRIASLLIDGAAPLGISPESLAEGTGLTVQELQRRGDSIPWDTFVRFMANAGEVLDDETLVDIGRAAVDHPVFRSLMGAVRILFTPLDFYRWVAPGGRDLLITCLTNSLIEREDGVVEMVSQLDEGRAPCRELFVTARGVFERCTVPMGYGPASIDLVLEEHGARFIITLPEGRPLLPWLRRWLSMPWTLRSAGRDLRDANDLLSDRQRELVARLVELENERTARKRAELESQRYRDHLEALLRERTSELELSRAALDTKQRLASLGTLAAGIAHQLNNPLGSILNAAEFAQMSRDDPSFPEIAEQTLADIRSQARRGGRIVHSVLKFSRGEPTEKWVQDLDETIERACRLTREHAQARGARITFEADDTPAPVHMNPLEIEQALVNLLQNATESGEDVHVHVQRRSGSAAEITIEDDGRGIDPDDLPHVLDPFFTRRLSDGGTGLGLSVAHGIVVEHGGELSLESAPGQGTIARLTLPLARPSSPRGPNPDQK